MTTWHWVRHGPTHEKTLVGWRDVPADLSDHAQIARLNAHLPRDAILVSSDLIRAAATADVLAHPQRRRLPHDEKLREMDFGEWDGMHARDVSEQHPELSRAYWSTPGDVAPPQGESWNAAARRVNAHLVPAEAMPAVACNPVDGEEVPAAHFGVILTQIQRALNISAHAAFAHKIDNLSATQITVSQAQWDVTHINHSP